MIPTSPASNLLSRTIPLKPSCAVGGPQKSNETTEELIRPCRSALVTGYSARLVRSFTTPLNGYCMRVLPLSQRLSRSHLSPACPQRWLARRLIRLLRAASLIALRQPRGSDSSLVDEAWIERLRGASEDPFLILRAHRGERLARHAEELGKRPG